MHFLPQYQLSNLPSSLLLWYYLNFSMKRVWEVCRAGSLPWNQSKGEQFLSWDVSTFPSYTNSGLSCPVSQIQMWLFPLLRWVCSRKGCCVRLNQVMFMAEWCREAEFLICVSKPVGKEFLMFAACALYLKDKIKGKCVCPSWPSLYEYLHFIPDHLRCGVYLLTIW